jgi:hypothetical protein
MLPLLARSDGDGAVCSVPSVANLYKIMKRCLPLMSKGGSEAKNEQNIYILPLSRNVK